MHKISVFFIALALISGTTASLGQTDGDKLYRLIRRADFTGAEQLLQSPGTQLTVAEHHFYQALVYNSFNDPAQSNQLLLKIRKDTAAFLPNDTLKKLYQATLYDNYVKLFDYKNAYRTGDALIKRFAHLYTPTQLDDEQQALAIQKALVQYQPQRLRKKGSAQLKVTRDIAGLMNIPVVNNDSTYAFIFDSGAGMSTIAASFAQKLGLTPVASPPIAIKSGLGIASMVQLAIAPKLTLGNNIEVYNTVFLVFPDSALSFADGAYKINAILGFPVAKELGEMIFENDSLLIPEKPQYATGNKNLAVDELKPVLFLTWNQRQLPFTFDTGAGSSLFSDLFHHAYMETGDTTATPKSMSVGGAGGSKDLQGISIPTLTLQNRQQPIVLRNAFVSKEPLSITEDKYYGNLGQDIIRQFPKMIINFTGGYLLFSK
ncbi:pepsin/retropepsin-like aspartic protease family protein [Deminuibacter soli]|uniref:Peptidase A2 domain-containing protein n=1 Tax=Deminuibacter soli TaxID=2291815 RepID=A0A3E1NPF3_9BACT|nr:pepsin/retropepsin-like aspartic protease family protein [Deminuibacter soli]RFM29815.1 hypothetical protein DXN05_02225 [Deminuibacter soli]